MPSSRDVVFVDGVRTPSAGRPKGMYAETRADDLVVRVIRELIRRNPGLPPERVDEVAIAATTQIGDQGLTIGRSAAVLAGLPKTVPGYAIDRMCAGAMTAVTTVAGGIAFGAYDVAIAGGVEHMGRHPMGEGVDPNPRFLAERLVDPCALVMGMTAENLHDRFPAITKDRADAYAVLSQEKVGQGVRRRPDPAGSGARRRSGRPRRAGAWRSRTRRRGPAPRWTGWARSRRRSAPTATSRRATPRAQRRRHRLRRGRRRRRRRARPGAEDAAGLLRLRRAWTPR